ncbi:MAG: methylenetetrahydrofolate reductase [Spirochaetota bacterium]
MTFSALLSSGEFLVTVDTIPPKGTDLSGVFRRISSLKNRVNGINVVDMPSAVMRMSAIALSYHLKEKGFTPILQMTCRDRNRLSLQADLLGASVLGIENFLILGGDPTGLSDDPAAQAVFDLDSIQLLSAARGLEEGYDLAGNKLHGSPQFCLGAALDPGAEPLEKEIEKAEKKSAAGADFFQTQPIYEAGVFSEFKKKISHFKAPILAGIFLLKSARMAHYMNENIPGIRVPKGIIAEMERAKDPVQKSIEIAIRTIASLRTISEGVHIMTIGWEDKIPLVLNELGL